MQHYNTQQTASAMTKVRFYYNSNKNIAYIHFSAWKLYAVSICLHNLVQNIENMLAHYVSFLQ